MARPATGLATILSSRWALPPRGSSLLMGERMVLKMYLSALRQRSSRSVCQQRPFPFSCPHAFPKTIKMDLGMRPIRNSWQTCRRFWKPNRWLSVSLSISEIQEVGSRGVQIANPSTSIFRTNISINHPLKPLLDKSLDTILQAVSPRTLQTYVTAWKFFKSYLSYNIPFPEFSLLSITAFISFLNSIKGLQVSSIKSYKSGIQFFHKLLYGAPSPGINNSQTGKLIRGIQRSRPTRPDSRLPITLDVLTKCIHTFRTYCQPPVPPIHPTPCSF